MTSVLLLSRQRQQVGGKRKRLLRILRILLTRVQQMIEVAPRSIPVPYYPQLHELIMDQSYRLFGQHLPYTSSKECKILVTTIITVFLSSTCRVKADDSVFEQ